MLQNELSIWTMPDVTNRTNHTKISEIRNF
jgi:hypothetical protein